MTKDEALKLALEALEHTGNIWHMNCPKNEAITAIKEVLEQPDQEPHSWYSAQEDEWMTHKTRKEHERLNSYTHKVGKFDLALYTTPPQEQRSCDRRTWVGLTDEEVITMSRYDLEYAALIGEVQRKLKEKNT